MATISEQRKAILAGAVALTGSLAVGLVDNALTAGEAAAAVAVGVAAYAGVYGVRNTPPGGGDGEGDVEDTGEH